ncbi:MAG: hypothetical protein WCY00_00625 [Candidatus Dojkabacteria bacterium]|jgi:hypothetical protein
MKRDNKSCIVVILVIVGLYLLFRNVITSSRATEGIDDYNDCVEEVRLIYKEIILEACEMNSSVHEPEVIKDCVNRLNAAKERYLINIITEEISQCEYYLGN